MHPVTVKCNGKNVSIYAVQTGQVAIKTAHRSKQGPHFLSPLLISFDSHFTEYMPVWVWVIEHPEGVIVIDTGENAGVMKADYFRPAGKIIAAYSKRNIKFQVSEEEQIGNQLKKIGITPDKIKCVVLTHLHLDHTDGLHDFHGTEIWVSEKEYKQPSGHIPQLYPSWFNPRLVEYKPDSIDVFHDSVPITRQEDVLLIPTNGHTRHHASVLLKTDDCHILFAGDVSYNQAQLLNNEIAGVNADYKLSGETYRKILAYSRRHELVYLPSHDPESAKRLKELTVL